MKLLFATAVVLAGCALPAFGGKPLFRGRRLKDDTARDHRKMQIWEWLPEGPWAELPMLPELSVLPWWEIGFLDPDLARLTVTHWDWNLCGGDGDGGSMFAFFNETCPEQQGVPPNWHFFPGGIDASDARTGCLVSKDDWILIPVVNRICWDGDDYECTNKPFYQSCIDFLIEKCSFPGETTEATLDGGDLAVYDLRAGVQAYTTNCPNDFADPYLDYDEFIGEEAVAVGLWVVIEPQSVGLHTVHIAGNNGEGFALDFTIGFEAV